MDAAEMLSRGATRETDIHRDRFGHWFDEGAPITHERLTRRFDGWIDRAPDGRFCLTNSINWAFVDIEGPPYFVRSVKIGQHVSLHLSGDSTETLDLATLRLGVDDSLWCDVREGRVPARFDNHALVQMGELLGEDSTGTFFRLGDVLVRPSVVSDPMTTTWDPSKGHVE